MVKCRASSLESFFDGAAGGDCFSPYISEREFIPAMLPLLGSMSLGHKVFIAGIRTYTALYPGERSILELAGLINSKCELLNKGFVNLVSKQKRTDFQIKAEECYRVTLLSEKI